MIASALPYPGRPDVPCASTSWHLCPGDGEEVQVWWLYLEKNLE